VVENVAVDVVDGEVSLRLGQSDEGEDVEIH
jgi:hypothetical protein